jgi:putative transposase
VSEECVLRWLWNDQLSVLSRSNLDDVELRDQVELIASERRRFGYRRIHVLLEREGIQVN